MSNNLSLPSCNIILITVLSGIVCLHCVIGTAFMYHQDLVTSVQTRFMAEYMACVERYQTQKSSMLWVCGIDQGHFTRMKEKEPGLFVNTGVGKDGKEEG